MRVQLALFLVAGLVPQDNLKPQRASSEVAVDILVAGVEVHPGTFCKRAMNEAQQAKVAAVARSFLARRQFQKEMQARKAQEEEQGIQAPFVPTSDAAIDLFVEQLLAPGDVLMDLGCGDGRVLFRSLCKASRTFGVEIQANQLDKARQQSIELHKQDVMTWLQADFFSSEVKLAVESCVTVCFVFLLPELVSNVAEFLIEHLREGSRVVCFLFAVGPLSGGLTWPASKILTVPNLPSSACTLYEYVVDADTKAKLQRYKSQ